MMKPPVMGGSLLENIPEHRRKVKYTTQQIPNA
jgi:hypothetical protein